VQPLATEVGLD